MSERATLRAMVTGQNMTVQTTARAARAWSSRR